MVETQKNENKKNRKNGKQVKVEYQVKAQMKNIKRKKS
jgi:hypothetical protein